MEENNDGTVVNITPEILQGMIDECENIKVSPRTLFVDKIGKIDVIDMVSLDNKATGQKTVTILDNDGGMWDIKEEYIIGHRKNMMEPSDYDFFNRVKKEAIEHDKEIEEKENVKDDDNLYS